MLSSLPAELLLAIFKYLPVSAIAACQLTCKDLKEIAEEHEPVIYRRAAAHPDLNLIPNESFDFKNISSLFSPRFLQGAANWKELCRRGCEVQKSWLGKGPSRIHEYGSALPKVHRFKVDEKRGFAVVSYQDSGLVVLSLREDKSLWDISQYDIPDCTFFTYDEGFLVIVHLSGDCEVWRLVSDDPSINIPDTFDVALESKPNRAMLDLAKRKEQYSPKTSLKFVPHAFLQTPDAVDCTFHLSYPTLMIANFSALTLWDIRKGIIVETIDNFTLKTWSPSLGPRTLPRPRAFVTEVECFGLNPLYALIGSSSGTLQVFCRRDVTSGSESPFAWDAGECVFEINGNANDCGRWVFEVGDVLLEEFSDDGLKEYQALLDEKQKPGLREERYSPGERVRRPWKRSDKVIVRHQTALSNVQVVSTSHESHFSYGCFSPCGQHIVGVVDGRRLVIIPYFERISKGEVKEINSLKIEVQFHAPHWQLSQITYEDDRIAIVTLLGIYIVNLLLPEAQDFDSPPQVHVQRISGLNDPKLLQDTSCLQITSTALWLNWGTRRARIPSDASPITVLDLEEEYDINLEREEATHEREIWMKYRDIRADDMNMSENSQGVQVVDDSVRADGYDEGLDDSEEGVDDSDEGVDEGIDDSEGAESDENSTDLEYSDYLEGSNYSGNSFDSGERQFEFNSLLFSVDFGLESG